MIGRVVSKSPGRLSPGLTGASVMVLGQEFDVGTARTHTVRAMFLQDSDRFFRRSFAFGTRGLQG